MKYTNLIIAVLFSLSIVFCTDWDEEEIVKRGNFYVDKILQDIVEERGNEFDPYALDDKIVSFKKKLIVSNISGEARLYNGTLKGLKTLHRTDYSILTETDDYFTIVAELGANELDLRYAASAKFMLYRRNLTIRAVADFIKISMSVQVDRKTGKDGHLNQLIVHEIQQPHIWVTGLGPMSWALTAISGAVVGIFQTQVKRIVEKHMKNHISRKIGDYQFPLEDLEFLYNNK